MISAAKRRLSIFIAHPSEVLTDHLPHGDGLVSYAFIRRLAERGHRLHVAAQSVDVRADLPGNLHIHHLSGAGRSAVDRLSFMLRMRMLFERLQREIAFDLIHQMNPVYTGLSLSLIGVRPPIVLGTFVPRWEVHSDPGLRQPFWSVATLGAMVGKRVSRAQQSRAAGLLIASQLALSRIAPPIDHPERIYEVPHGIDLAQFRERAMVPARPSVLFLANVIYRKGIFTLLDAFAQLLERVPDAELVIAGGGDDLPEVRRRVAALLAQRPGCTISVMGHVARQDVHDLMRAHSVYCLPSYGEPFGMTVLEAMACGVPVVATRAGGIPDLVTDDGGRLVPVRDASALAGALAEVLGSRDLQQRMGRHNRLRVETVFEVEKTVDRLEEAYYAILERRHGTLDGSPLRPGSNQPAGTPIVYRTGTRLGRARGRHQPEPRVEA